MAKVKPRGKSWYLHVGKKKTSLGRITEAEAYEILALKEAELARERIANVVTLPKAKLDFAEWAKLYLDWHEKQWPDSHWRIRQIIEQHLIPHFKSRISRITHQHAERYKRKRVEAGAKASTVNKELRTLIACLNRAELELKEPNPLRGLVKLQETDSKPPRWYTKEELALIYKHSVSLPGDEAAKGRPINSPIKDYAPIWKLLANTGLRRAEALALPWANVTSVIRVESTTSSRTKSRKWRQIPISSGAKDAIDQLRFVTGQDVRVLPRIRPESVTRAFDRCLKRAGLDGSLHCLRHSFCSHLAMKGLDIYTIKELAGHSSVVTTGKYMHLSPDYLQGAVEGFEL